MKHIVSFSGGKDSTTMLLMMIDKGMQIDDIIFCEVMETDETSGEYPEMENYINKIEQHIGRKITRIKSKHTFNSVFYQKKQKGDRKGQIYGFPLLLKSWCNDRLKMKAINEYYKSLNDEFIVYIGIAADEPKRLARLKANQKAPLAQWGVTEQECKKYLENRGLLNPLYNKFTRLGCWFCPKQSLKSLRVLYKDYPKLWNKMLRYDIDSPHSFKIKYSVKDLDKRFKKEQYLTNLKQTFETDIEKNTDLTVDKKVTAQGSLDGNCAYSIFNYYGNDMCFWYGLDYCCCEECPEKTLINKA